MKLVIPGTLPGLNQYIEALGKNHYAGAALKKEAQRTVEWCAKSQLRKFRPTGPVWMKYTWYEPNKCRDKDNISSFGRKVIQDGLVKAGVLENDGWRHIDGFSDRFRVDEKRPRVEVEIIEVETCLHGERYRKDALMQRMREASCRGSLGGAGEEDKRWNG